MRVVQDFIPQGRKNRPAGVNPMNFLTIHNTGNTNKGANAEAHARYVKGDTAAGLPVSWHYTVDDGAIFQHLPDNETAFHAGDGDGNGNRQSIGIEICQNSDGDLLQATQNAIQLCATLCHRHNIPVTNVVQHNHWSANKGCPQELRLGRPYSWSVFISKVTDALELLQDPPPFPNQSPEELTVERAFGLGILGDKQHWVEVLRGTRTPVPEYIKRILDNSINIIEECRK